MPRRRKRPIPANYELLHEAAEVMQRSRHLRTELEWRLSQRRELTKERTQLLKNYRPPD